MPPVFGPWSPSRRRLWSWLVASGRTCAPSLITMKLASSPSRNSSITTRAPAAPSFFAVIMSSIAACASATLVATTTPLPAARPSALTTIGAPRSSRRPSPRRRRSKVRCSAVGMPWRTMKLLAKSLDASSCAAARVGPKIFRPASGTRRPRPRRAAPRADHGEVDLLFLRESDQVGDLGEGDVLHAVLGRGAAVAGRDEHLLHARALRELPRQRVLAPAGADDEEFHLNAGSGACR